ncbi:hypothetical protein BDW22DRAFT_1427351 [Trametopsis cervina]|nr:hypothetical protein BDW22DRAFT_1427351 [Trametopsis cervina]
MEDGLHYAYPTTSDYSQIYYAAQQHVPSSMPMASMSQPEPLQRKRPKYTRSKTGCLTCRTKKVKCDEEKPDCARCHASNRKCVWPDGLATRKRSTRRESRPSHSPSVEGRPSTAGSSGMSETSTPPARHYTPPKLEPVEHSLPPPARRPLSDYGYAQGSLERESPQRVPDIRGYQPTMSSHATVPNVANNSSYYPAQHQHHQHHQHAQIQQPLPVSLTHHHAQQQQIQQQPHPQAHHPYHTSHVAPQQPYLLDSVKVEDPQDWQAPISQHVDPIHPFAVSPETLHGRTDEVTDLQYPTMQYPYQNQNQNRVGNSAHYAPYPYMKYHQ